MSMEYKETGVLGRNNPLICLAQNKGMKGLYLKAGKPGEAVGRWAGHQAGSMEIPSESNLQAGGRRE